MIAAAGFKMRAVEDITKNVVHGAGSRQRAARSHRHEFSGSLRKDFRDWSGVKDFRAYNRLKTGEWVYRITRATR